MISAITLWSSLHTKFIFSRMIINPQLFYIVRVINFQSKYLFCLKHPLGDVSCVSERSSVSLSGGFTHWTISFLFSYRRRTAYFEIHLHKIHEPYLEAKVSWSEHFLIKNEKKKKKSYSFPLVSSLLLTWLSRLARCNRKDPDFVLTG